ncbi:MAG: hypothetical protein NTY53_23295 [Kiritimatiellaeota bacterium]|nr:hypothetical protein [Kiritimatiellota bacterium]
MKGNHESGALIFGQIRYRLAAEGMEMPYLAGRCRVGCRGRRMGACGWRRNKTFANSHARHWCGRAEADALEF